MRESFAQKKYGWHKKVGRRKLKRMLGLVVCFFFSFFSPANFRILASKTKPSANDRKAFFFGSKKTAKIAIF
jgi:hypothetical protein